MKKFLSKWYVFFAIGIVIFFLILHLQGWVHTVRGDSDSAVCFSSEKDVKEFINNKTDYMVIFPCPTGPANLLNQTFPEDESGK